MCQAEVAHAFREQATRASPHSERSADDEVASADDAVRWLCAACRTKITDGSAVFGPTGAAPVQVFTNPEGRVCQVLTVLHAQSLSLIGPATDEYTWFPGFAWRVALCAHCFSHLGWRYQAIVAGASPPVFFGLLLDALVEERDFP
jgi:hypothetical protein